MASAGLITLGFPTRLNTSASFGTFTLNGTTDQWEVVFQAPEAITITKLGFRYGSRTGTPPTYKISLQGVGTDGNPDGAIKGGGSPASKTFTPPADTTWNSTWREQTLDNSYACARGEYLAAVIAYDSGTVDGSNNSSFTTNNNMSQTLGLPFCTQNDAGSRSRQNGCPTFGYASASKVYGAPGLAGITSSITSTSEAALKFTLTSGLSSTFQVVGARFLATLAAGKTLTASLYQGGLTTDTGTVLQQVTLDTDAASANAVTRFFDVYFDESTLSTLTVGSSYRLSLIVDSGTNTLSGMSVNAAADWDAWAGGQMFALSTRSGGDWTDTTASRPFVDLILADLTGGSGSGAPSFGMGSPLFRGRP